MERKYDVIAVGDLMLDFTYIGNNDAGIAIYERNPGGSPMNVAAQVAKLGGRPSVITTVGEDEHGKYLKNVMESLNVDTSGIGFSKTMGTRILFVHFKDHNDRYFLDYKGPRSDLDIHIEQINFEIFRECKVFLYTPLAHETEYPIYETVNQMIRKAKESNLLLAYDPNYRFPYRTKEEQNMVVNAVKTADILKISIEEIELVLCKQDVLAAVDELLENGVKIIAVTMGKNGCLLCTKRAKVCRPSYNVSVVDTCGAGDSFMGALIYSVTHMQKEISDMTLQDLKEIADFCNACASAVTMQHGSLLVMSNMENAQKIIDEVPSIEQDIYFDL